MKAKHVDMWFSKIGSVVFVVFASILNWWLKWNIDYKAIIAVGLFIFVVGLPISVSYWIEGIGAVVKARTGVQLPPMQVTSAWEPASITTTKASTTPAPGPQQG